MIHNNSLLTSVSEIFNINPYFKVAYDNIIDILYYGVKEIGFTAQDLLHELAFYEILDIIAKWQEDVKEKNKQQEAENERYDSMMSDMRRQQTITQQTFKQNNNSYKAPSMPALPKF